MNRQPTGVVVQDVSAEEVLHVMTGAASQDPVQVQACSERFKELLQMNGTFEALHSIAAQRSFPLPVRKQSIIQFKNVALNQWRSRKLLSDEQRSKIRARSLTFLNEEDETIAACNKVIVSKIARQDLPNNWSNLIDDLMATIETHLRERYETASYDERRTLPLLRALQLLNGIIKEFASFKMLQGVRTMAQLFVRLHQVLYEYYSRISVFFSPDTMTTQSTDSLRTFNDIYLANLTYKCLSKMTVWVWQRIEKDKASAEGLIVHEPWIKQLFQDSALQLKRLADLRHRIITSRTAISSQARKTVDMLTKHILVVGKFFRRLSQVSHPRFVGMPMCDDLILFYWSQVVDATGGQPELISDSNDALYPIRFLVQGMVLFKENLSQWAPTRKDGTPNPNITLPPDFIENAVKLVVTRFMPLNSKDLQRWVADPEEWMNMEEKDNDQWEYEIRPCSERLLMSLAKEFPDNVTPLLVATFQNFALQPSLDLQSVIQKEALYCALGRCCSRLKDSIKFEDWLARTLSAEAQDTNPSFPIIKRRIAWLIGKWVLESSTSPNNPLIWTTLGHLLADRQEGTDVVVRLTAAVAIGECVGVLEFDPNIFAPFLSATISQLVSLLAEADTFESKSRVAIALNSVIEHSEDRIVPLVNVIIDPLPGLWTDAGELWMFKATLIHTVKTLISAIKEQSVSLGRIVVPLIKESISTPARMNLDEDGMKLLLTALRNTTMVHSVNGAPALIELFPDALSTLGNLDMLGTAVNILESYLLLDASFILQNAAMQLFTTCLSTMKNAVITINVRNLLAAINLLVQVTPSSLWGVPMHETGFFSQVLLHLIEGKGSTLVLIQEIHLLARMVIADPQMYLQLMTATANKQNVEEGRLYNQLLDQWWNKFDNMSEPRHRKLSAMGMAALVSTGRPEVLERIPGDIFNLWLDVFGEIKEVQETRLLHDNMSPASPQSLRRHWELDEAPADFYQGTEGTAEYNRRKAVYDSDPVRTVQLSKFVAQHLQEAEARCGQQAFQELYLSKVDPTVLKQIQDELRNI